VVDLVAGQGRCTRRFAQSARKSVKYLLSPEKTVRYIARTVFLNAKTAAGKGRPYWPEIITLIKNTREN